MLKRPGGLSDGPNARSKSVTVADGDDTFGVCLFLRPYLESVIDGQALNCHPAVEASRSKAASPPSVLKGTFRVGVSEDKNKRCRRTMEDAHSFVYDYAGVRGQGYFAVFE